MKYCVHANCSQKTYIDQLCKFHRDEAKNNGKEGHFTCTWCTEWNQMEEDMLRSRFDVGSGIELDEDRNVYNAKYIDNQ